jgi:hypothetical protein
MRLEKSVNKAFIADLRRKENPPKSLIFREWRGSLPPQELCASYITSPAELCAEELCAEVKSEKSEGS